MKRCSECGAAIEGRSDRQTCSARCRVARGRRLGRIKPCGAEFSWGGTDRCNLPAGHADAHAYVLGQIRF